MDSRVLITNDVLDVTDKIKEIDGDYFVVFNLTRKRFEVHSRRQRGSTLALVLPYDRLDNRAVALTGKTRLANNLKRAQEIEEHNERIKNAELRTGVFCKPSEKLTDNNSAL